MISIRKGCFETNSSSMHSLAIWKKVKPYDDYDLSLGTKYDSNKDVFELLDDMSQEEEDYSFHRYPYRQLTTPIEKLRYVVGLYVDYEYPKDKETGETNYSDYPKVRHFFTDKAVEEELTNLIKKYTGCKSVKWHFEHETYHYKDGKKIWYDEEEWPSTSTSNDRGEDITSFIKRKNITLEDLIFKPNYTIQVDGDEYCEFRDMFDFNMINLNNLEDISSGIDYWTRNIYNFYIDEVLNQDYGPIDDCKPYLERVKEELKYGMLVNIDSFGYIFNEDTCKIASDFLKQHKDKCRFKFYHRIPQDIRDKYFSWVVSEGDINKDAY